MIRCKLNKLISFMFLIILSFSALSNSSATENFNKPKCQWKYEDSSHTINDDIKLLASVYVIGWPLYYITQTKTFNNKGSFKTYAENFGDLVFDKDEPLWNTLIHPYSGSQLFLFFRAHGYSRKKALTMSIISSTLFEFTVEIYTEAASVQDLYQTPILGSIIGIGIENLSLYLLNSQSKFAHFFGHLINPFTLFSFYDGRMRLAPKIINKKLIGINFLMAF